MAYDHDTRQRLGFEGWSRAVKAALVATGLAGGTADAMLAAQRPLAARLHEEDVPAEPAAREPIGKP